MPMCEIAGVRGRVLASAELGNGPGGSCLSGATLRYAGVGATLSFIF